MSISNAAPPLHPIKEPGRLSDRIRWLREYYFEGVARRWNNEFTVWSTGTPWDVQFPEFTFYIVPETYMLMQTLRSSYRQAARPVDVPPGFFGWSLPERRAWFVREVMVNRVPREVLPGDLLAGARFNVMTSFCLTEAEQKEFDRMLVGPGGAREQVTWFHSHGYGNAGATSGHLIPDHRMVLEQGWKGIHQDLVARYERLTGAEKRGAPGGQLRAMLTASTMARDLAAAYATRCRELAAGAEDPTRAGELRRMAANLDRVPWEPPRTFWEALQALWINHMLILSDENYPGPGISFGRFDQFLLPYWERSLAEGMDREFGKELMRCFWIHCNTAYDAQIRSGNQGITAGFGQLLTLSGLGAGGQDMTNDLTWAVLEVIDEMSPILEPKPNVRLHRGSPDALLDRVVDMIAGSQGAPFLLNFDERSMAGMLRQARLTGLEHRIHEGNVHEYAPVGCLENTMVGNDRSGTVDNNVNLLKAVELVLGGGRDLLPTTDPLTGKVTPPRQDGPRTGDPVTLETWDAFWAALETQMAWVLEKTVMTHEASEEARARFFPTPYLSCLVRGCAEKALDVTRGGAEIALTTMEAVTFATTVDSLLAVKHLVYDTGTCTMAELVQALKDNWEGHAVLQARALHKAPKYGRDDDEADALGRRVMELWCDLTWGHRTRSTGRQYRPGMLSWNYWAGDGFVLAASPDGRAKGRFLSNAICPSNGADIHGPTANANSVGKVLGGRPGDGDWEDTANLLPNGASHTMTFNPSLLRDPEHRDKFKAFLRGYAETGGTALQVNILDPQMLKDAQERPRDYRHLLVRVTGYNAYFTSVGRELQDELIARLSHDGF